MAKNAFEISDVLSIGWKGFKNNAVIFVALAILGFVAGLIINTFFSFLPYAVTLILSMAISSYFMLSLTRASLIAANGGIVDWNILKNDSTTYIKFLIVTVLFSLIITIGMMLLILPALFLGAVFFPVSYIIAEKSDTPIAEVFAKSWRIAIPQIWQLLVLAIVCVIIAFFGFLALIIGTFVAAPVIYIALAAVYKKLEGGSVDAVPAAPAANETEKTINSLIK